MASTLSTMPPIMISNPAARAKCHMPSDSTTPLFIILMLMADAERSRISVSTSLSSAPIRRRR